MPANCPDCGAKLGKGAYKCRCGWRMDAPQRHQHRDCAHAPACTKNATIREKTPTGWAAFCEDHYVAYHHAISAKRVREELGLHTVEEMKAYIRHLLRNPKPGSALAALKNRGVFSGMEREPGQDDEEKAA